MGMSRSLRLCAVKDQRSGIKLTFLSGVESITVLIACGYSRPGFSALDLFGLTVRFELFQEEEIMSGCVSSRAISNCQIESAAQLRNLH